MTILTVGNSNGKRRCDGTCHKAKKPNCHCICGGKYHGTGSSEKSQEMLTRDWLGDDWNERKAEIEARGGNFQAVVNSALLQARLPLAALVLCLGLAGCGDNGSDEISATGAQKCTITVNGKERPC